MGPSKNAEDRACDSAELGGFGARPVICLCVLCSQGPAARIKARVCLVYFWFTKLCVCTVVCLWHVFDISKVEAQANKTTTLSPFFPSFRGRKRLRKMKPTGLVTYRDRRPVAQDQCIQSLVFHDLGGTFLPQKRMAGRSGLIINKS